MSPFNKHSLNKQNEATKWYIKSKAEISYIILDYVQKRHFARYFMPVNNSSTSSTSLNNSTWCFPSFGDFRQNNISSSSNQYSFHMFSTIQVQLWPYEPFWIWWSVETVYFNLFWLFIISLKLCWILLEPNDDSNSLIKSIHYKILQWTEAFSRISLVYIPISKYLSVVL